MDALDDDLYATLDALVGLETPSDRVDLREPVAEVRRLLEAVPGRRGDVEVLGPTERPVLLARFGAGPPEVLFLGHVDVVPPGEGWTVDPFALTERDGRLHGRGTSDMKGGVAGVLWAVEQAANEAGEGGGAGGDGGDGRAGDGAPSVAVALTSDEETTMHGARALADHAVLDEVEVVVLPEFTALDVGLGEKGLFQFALTTEGESAHASVPHRGRNAVLDAVRLLRPLADLVPADDAEAERSVTVNVGRIEGGLKVNVVPDRCRVEVDVRYPPGTTEEEVRTRLFGRLDEVGVPYETEVLHAVPPVAAPADHPDVRAFLEAAGRPSGRVMTYATDAGRLADRLAARDVPAVIYGPGEMTTPHRPDEWVDPRKVQRAAEVYRDFLATRRGGGSTG